MSTIDLDDELIVLSMDALEDLPCPSTPVLFQSTRPSPLPDLSSLDAQEKKMSDITDLLSSSVLTEDEEDQESSLSHSIIDYLRSHSYSNEKSLYEHYQWQLEENYLRHGSKQLSPSDYQTRQSLYNRPVAFEKDSRSWARSLLNNFKKSNSVLKSKSSAIDLSYYFPMLKKSSSFDHHVQYIEHLNECNDYPAYLEYLRENRSQLFYTLTDSIDIIDGLIGTMVSSY